MKYDFKRQGPLGKKIFSGTLNTNKGFSLVELIVVIAIMAVLVVILAPALLQYNERSRAEKDNKTMDEVLNVMELALADQEIYDEVLAYSTTDNISCYIDTENEANYQKIVTKSNPEGVDQYTFDSTSRQLDETPFYAAGNMRGVTITFAPDKGSNGSTFDLAQGVVNQYIQIKGNQRFGALPKLYSRIKSSIGETVINNSQTYRNSEYTIFIALGTTGGADATAQDAIRLYGQWSGTNLPAEVSYKIVSDRVTGDDGKTIVEIDDNKWNQENGNKITVNPGDLNGGGSFTPGTLTGNETDETEIPEKEYNPEDFLVSGNEFIALSDTNMSIVIGETEMTMKICETPVANLPITKNGNTMTVSAGTEYDGTYTFFADGYVELNGEMVAKSKELWLNVDEGEYLIIHNENVYFSPDGNIPFELIYDRESIIGGLNLINEQIDAAGGTGKLTDLYPYVFSKYNNEPFTTKNVYDVLAMQTIQDKGHGFYFAFTGCYDYWGGAAQDSIVGNKKTTNATWNSGVSAIVSTSVNQVTPNGEKPLSLDTPIDQKVVKLVETTDYYYNNKKTNNIFIVEDQPFAYGDGMTYRDWIHSSYSSNTCMSPGWASYNSCLYFPEEILDKSCGGYESGMGIEPIFVDCVGPINSGGECINYCDGDVKLNAPDSYEYQIMEDSNYNYKGLWYGVGEGVLTSSIKSYDFYNYFIRQGCYPESVYMNYAFSKTSEIETVDISSYITDSISGYDRYIRIDWKGLREELGIPKNEKAVCAIKDGDYIVLMDKYSSSSSSDYASFDISFKNDKNLKTCKAGVVFFYEGKYYEGWCD